MAPPKYALELFEQEKEKKKAGRSDSVEWLRAELVELYHRVLKHPDRYDTQVRPSNFTIWDVPETLRLGADEFRELLGPSLYQHVKQVAAKHGGVKMVAGR